MSFCLVLKGNFYLCSYDTLKPQSYNGVIYLYNPFVEIHSLCISEVVKDNFLFKYFV